MFFARLAYLSVLCDSSKQACEGLTQATMTRWQFPSKLDLSRCVSLESRYFTRALDLPEDDDDKDSDEEEDDIPIMAPPTLHRRFRRLLLAAPPPAAPRLRLLGAASAPELGWLALSASALMQLASARSDLLMLEPSFKRAPRLLVADARSDPAKSIRDMMPVETRVRPPPRNFLQATRTCSTACERELTAFAAVPSVVRRVAPSSMSRNTSLAVATGISWSPATLTTR